MKVQILPGVYYICVLMYSFTNFLSRNSVFNVFFCNLRSGTQYLCMLKIQSTLVKTFSSRNAFWANLPRKVSAKKTFFLLKNWSNEVLVRDICFITFRTPFRALSTPYHHMLCVCHMLPMLLQTSFWMF